MGDHKVDRLRERALTRGEVSLAQLHRASSWIVFGAALALMSLSLVSIYWALDLVGMPPLLALIGALALEGGMAWTAHTATTIRKPRPPKKDGAARPDGYYLHLWVIYSAVTLLAQAANVWHAMVSVADFLVREPKALPPWMPESAAYWFAGAFALLFPLGGTLFVHVSGFLRVHGAGADWIDTDAQTVQVRDETGSTARASRPRATRAPQGETHAPPVEPRELVASEPRGESVPDHALEYPRDPARQALLETLVVRLRAQPDAAAKDLATTDEVMEAIGISDKGNARTARLKLYEKARARLQAEPRPAASLVITDPYEVEQILDEDRAREPVAS